MKPYQGILALIGYLVLQILVARFISVEYYEPIAGFIALFAAGWLLHKKRMLHLSSRDLKGSQLLFCVGIGLGLALISKMAIVFGVLSQEPVSEQTTVTLFYWIQYMVTRSVLIPAVEELLYRGILFGAFSRYSSFKTAIVCQAVLFMLTHRMISWPSVFVIGVLLAWIYWQTDNLAVTMVIHCITNFGGLLATPLYILLTTHRTIGVIVCLFVVFLGILITYLSTKNVPQKA